MFKSARIKLTAFYLLIIMTITISFSGLIYASISSEAKRAIREHERRVELRLKENPRFPAPPERFQEAIGEDTLRSLRTRLVITLVLINIIILLSSGSLGYVLAGLTLEPIEKMLEKQKKFVSDAAHEFKTPLTSIKTQLEVGIKYKKFEGSEGEDIAKSILDDVNGMTNLTNTLLDASRHQIQNGSGTALEDVLLREVISKSIKKISPLSEAKNITIDASGAENDIKLNIADSDIKRILQAILENAIKFNNESGKVIIKTYTDAKSTFIQITDTGIGIAKKDIPYIFDRFYKADTSRTKTNDEGYGLGLAMAKDITEVYKGRIEVESELDKGTTLIIKFPKVL